MHFAILPTLRINASKNKLEFSLQNLKNVLFEKSHPKLVLRLKLKKKKIEENVINMRISIAKTCCTVAMCFFDTKRTKVPVTGNISVPSQSSVVELLFSFHYWYFAIFKNELFQYIICGVAANGARQFDAIKLDASDLTRGQLDAKTI